MAQTNYSVIQLYRSTTGGAAPSSANLSPGELALNLADVAAYMENSSGNVIKLMNNPAGLTYPTTDGSNGQAILTNGSGTLSLGDVVRPTAAATITGANTFNAKQTFNGSSSQLATVLGNAAEKVTVSATAATGTINFDVTTQSVLYYTSNSSANWTMNFRASSGTSLNSAMDTGQSVTLVFLATNGATAYYNNVVQVDGSSVTPKYQGGIAWTFGTASGIDAYTYTIIKTGSGSFTVLASQIRFA
jgi:hypothetical protein